MFYVRAGIQRNRERMKKNSLAEGKRAVLERCQSLRSERFSGSGSVWQSDIQPEPTSGYAVPIRGRQKVEENNLRILSCLQSDSSTPWKFFSPKEEQLSLFFLRSIFTCLRKQMKKARQLETGIEEQDQYDEPGKNVDDNIPVAAFQRAFERLFYVLGDEEPFQATEYDANNNGCVGWGEFSYLYKRRYIGIRWSPWERVYRTLDDPESSILAQIVSIFVLLTITVSSLTFIFSTVPDMKDERDTFTVIEDVCLIIFTLEYCLRFCTVWRVRLEVLDKKRLMELACGYDHIVLASPIWRVIYFLTAPANLIDLAAILPGIISWFVKLEGGAFVVLRLIRLTRIFRAFKNPKLQEPVIVIAQTLVDSTKALYVLAFNLGLGIVIFGSLMYLAEEGDDGEARGWKSIPHSLWVGLVTATTVGYGDMFPVTTLGYVVTTLCMVSSLAILALPVGVIGGNFDAVWQKFLLAQTESNKEIAQDRKFLLTAMQTVNPREMSRLMLIEVWNERLPNLQIDKRVEGVHFRPAPGEFLGQVTLKLELPHDQPYYSGPITLPLKPNYDIVKREVSGTITIEYEWILQDTPVLGSASPPAPGLEPVSPTTVAPSEAQGAGGVSDQPPDLIGQLRVSLLCAENLLNVVFLRHPPVRCSPYCIVFCYPNSPKNRSVLHYPSAWRSPTCKERRIDPTMSHRNVTLDEYRVLHKHEGLDEDRMRADWQDLKPAENTANATWAWEVENWWNFAWTTIASTPRGRRKESLLGFLPPDLAATIARLNPALQGEILHALRCFSQDMVQIKRDVAILCDRFGISVMSDGENVKKLLREMAGNPCGEPREQVRIDEPAAQVATTSSTFAAAPGDTASSAAPSPEPFESSPSSLLPGLLQSAPETSQ